MRLSELSPHWLSIDGQKLGISFLCPHCKTQRLGVAFHHAGREQFDDAHIQASGYSAPIWTETNPEDDTFDNLTLSPSIDCSASGHWHGFITNGEVT